MAENTRVEDTERSVQLNWTKVLARSKGGFTVTIRVTDKVTRKPTLRQGYVDSYTDVAAEVMRLLNDLPF